METAPAPICLVIANGLAVQEVVAGIVSAAGLKPLLLAGLAEMTVVMQETAISGILLETATWVRGSHQERTAAQESLNLFRCAKFRIAGNQVFIIGQSLEDFLEQCRRATPRPLRKGVRLVKYYPVLLSRDPDFQDAEKTSTFNVSKGGCFVWSVREWEVGARVWLHFVGEETPLTGEVRFWFPWGEGETIPGIGIRLDAGREEI